MSVSRRILFSGAPAALLATPAVAEAARPGRRIPKMSPDYALPFGGDFIGPDNDPLFSGAKGAAQIGSGSSKHGEVATAFRLLFGAAGKKTPLEVARYFAALKDVNEDEEPYTQEWAQRANPLITGFFSMTHTLPNKGDETPWCAAFVTFCLYAANRPTKLSAWARSYVGYGGPAIADPRPGDLAVFRRGKASGHVGFFTRWEQDKAGKPTGRFFVLGGNQGQTKTMNGAVVEKVFDMERLIGFYRVKGEA